MAWWLGTDMKYLWSSIYWYWLLDVSSINLHNLFIEIYQIILLFSLTKLLISYLHFWQFCPPTWVETLSSVLNLSFYSSNSCFQVFLSSIHLLLAISKFLIVYIYYFDSASFIYITASWFYSSSYILYCKAFILSSYSTTINWFFSSTFFKFS